MSQISSHTSSPSAAVQAGFHRLIERLAVGDIGEGVGHAFLAHICQLGAQFGDLLRGACNSPSRLLVRFPWRGWRRSAHPPARAGRRGCARRPVRRWRRTAVVILAVSRAEFSSLPSTTSISAPILPAQRLHRLGSARARQAAQPKIGSSSGVKGFWRRYGAHHLGDGGVLAGGIGIEEFEIVGRGNDTGAAHQGERRLGKCLFAVPVEHFSAPISRKSARPLCKKR